MYRMESLHRPLLLGRCHTPHSSTGNRRMDNLHNMGNNNLRHLRRVHISLSMDNSLNLRTL